MDLDEHERIAKAATPGPYTLGPEKWTGLHDVLTEPDGAEIYEHVLPNDAAYAVANSPDVTLKLIARVRELDAIADEALKGWRDDVMALSYGEPIRSTGQGAHGQRIRRARERHPVTDFNADECARLIAEARDDGDAIDKGPLAEQLEAAVREVAKLKYEVGKHSLLARGWQARGDQLPVTGSVVRSDIENIAADRDALRAELGRLQDVLGHLRGISDLGRPCELCVYANGVYVRRCSMHAEIDGLRAEVATLRADDKSAAGECLVPVDAMTPGSHLRRVVKANRMWRYERDDLRATVDKLTEERDGMRAVVDAADPWRDEMVRSNAPSGGYADGDGRTHWSKVNNRNGRLVQAVDAYRSAKK